MPLVSVIMPCYNADKYLAESVESLIAQTFRDWELVIVDDGSTDRSLSIAGELSKVDPRIRVVHQDNGGYVSARLYGYQFISPDSKYLLFYDADDRLHPEMLRKLVAVLHGNERLGAAYCDHLFMDEKGILKDHGSAMPRFVPSTFWVKKLPETEAITPFISIFCWTKMIEPMTLIRRSAYEKTNGWDLDFGKGQGNIGDGVYLFSEIALKWQVKFLNEPLYYYRRHGTQSSAVSSKIMGKQADKILKKWEVRTRSEHENKIKIKAAINFFRFRLQAYKVKQSFKHQLRYHPLTAPKYALAFLVGFIGSVRYCAAYRKYLME